MAHSHWFTGSWRRWMGASLLLLTLLALACAPAQQPTAAPETTAAPEATAPPEATAVPKYGEISTTGTYVERAGLRFFIPEGYEFGGPIFPPDPRPPRYGGMGVAAHPGDPPSLDPYHTTSYLENYTAATSYDALVRFYEKAGVDPLNNPMIGGLAESWEVSDDFLTYTFHLRKGVKFHNLPPVNGRELEAEDVKATLELYRDPGSIIKAFLASVDRVEVVDRYTVALHMKEVEPQMLTWLGESSRGAILPRELAQPASHARRGGGIGTGPFMVDKEYEYKVGITFKRHPDYWVFDDGPGQGNRLPYLDGRRVVVIADTNARLTAFRTGKIDWSAGDVVSGGVVGMRKFMQASPNTLVSASAGLSSSCYCLRLDKEPWSDVRVRRALAMAIDYEAVAQTIFGQPALVMGNSVPGVFHGSDDSLTTVTKLCACPWYTYDPQRAKALLAEAGFPNGFSTTFEYFAYGQSWIEQAEFVASYWKAIGVDAKLQSMDYTVFRRNVDIGGWENISHSFTCCGSVTQYTAMQFLFPGGAKNPQYGFINDPKIAALAKEVIASYRDEAKQQDLYREARAYYLDQVFNLPLVSGVGYSVIAPRLRNFQNTNKMPSVHQPRGWMYTWIDDEWDFAK